VHQRGEPLLPFSSCCLTYPLDANRRMCPALCPAVAVVGRVSLGQPASLHRLRHRSPGVVRRLCRYYQAVRRPAVVHHCRTSMDFAMRPAMLVIAGNRGISRFPNAVRPCMPGVSDRAGSRHALRERRVGYGLPPTYTASAPRSGHDSRRGSSFRGSIPGLHVPLSTLRRPGLPLSTHDSGPLWVATPSTSRTCIDNTAPISPAHIGTMNGRLVPEASLPQGKPIRRYTTRRPVPRCR
jgi:hypothetical protein